MSKHHLAAVAISLGLICNFHVYAQDSSKRMAEDEKDDTEYLVVDPLLIAQASEVWRFISAEDNKIWKNWDASKTPILFYLPGKQDVLINHPAPPEGFSLYQGGIKFPSGQVYVRNGETLFAHDGQNTRTNIAGIESLVVADTLSNRKNNVAGMIYDPRDPMEKINGITYEQLGSDPYDSMGMIAHEGFHVFQYMAAGNKGGDELSLKKYPTLSVKNNVGFALEGRSLLKVMEATSVSEAKKAAIEWLAIRHDRRKSLSEELIAYEDGTEFSEGLAKYVEYRLFEVLEGRNPGERMEWIQGFKGYSDLSFLRARLESEMLSIMRGEVNVNNDPYGTAPLRMRLYYSGMAIAVMLDRLKIDWKEAILKPKTTLTGLVSGALSVDEEYLINTLTAVTQGDEYDAIIAKKTALQKAGQDRAIEMVKTILKGNNTLVIIDYSRLPNLHIAMGFSPFGIVNVDAERTIFGQSSISARLRKETIFRQSSVSPVIQDDAKGQFLFQLTEKISRTALVDMMKGNELDTVNVIEKLDLPGVRIDIGRAIVRWDDEKIVIQLLPVESGESN